MADILAMNLTKAIHDVGNVPHRRLTDFLLDEARYSKRIRPVYNHLNPTHVHISMSLYQIIQNEPEQNIKMNIWMIQSWVDEFLGWNPADFNGITSLILPHNSLWIPDTYLYNSVVMAHDETERYMNIKLDTLFNEGKVGAKVSFLYPAIYTVTCWMNVRYFPYDLQNCTLVIGSWTHDSSALDYSADLEVNMAPYIDNEEWKVEKFTTYRHVTKYNCCLRPWIILRAHLIIRRKPLYYLVNLIIPTSIITLVSIMGFFTPASTEDDRKEKINLGITTLLAMSILMLIVSDSMPTTSEFVPLIAWFYLSIIMIISVGTFLTTIILSIHAKRTSCKLPPPACRSLMFGYVACWVYVHPPPALASLWNELDVSFFGNLEDKSTTPPVKNPLTSTVTQTSPLTATPASRSSRGMWGNAISLAGFKAAPSASSKPSKVTSFYNLPNSYHYLIMYVDNSSENKTMLMKQRRQCSLEWEFLATVLDRVFLIIFSLAVIFVTAALMLIGTFAHRNVT
ncbi:unnamed protein product [Enterobius vermicularis]|uniref:Neur_chan_LBD domain-containing protein n=1 Tax=Enterobius vermicularis TaxID=51028 RepID=A0A158Q964_ENTVE|nr:unnamed protein product [Enterobius vermicularis]